MKISKRMIKENMGMTNQELLNWSMNQLFRAARTLQMAAVGAISPPDGVVQAGCDLTATVILKRLVKTKQGYNLVKKTNPKLLRGYKKPK